MGIESGRPGARVRARGSFGGLRPSRQNPCETWRIAGRARATGRRRPTLGHDSQSPAIACRAVSGNIEAPNGRGNPPMALNDDSAFESRIGKGTKASGKLNFRGPVKIEGEAEGEITGDEVVIASGAVVSARISAAKVIDRWRVQRRNDGARTRRIDGDGASRSARSIRRAWYSTRARNSTAIARCRARSSLRERCETHPGVSHFLGQGLQPLHLSKKTRKSAQRIFSRLRDGRARATTMTPPMLRRRCGTSSLLGLFLSHPERSEGTRIRAYSPPARLRDQNGFDAA